MTPEQILDRMEAINRKDGPIEKKFETWLALLASYRQHQLLKELIDACGSRVQAGPFEGLDLRECHGRNIMPLFLLGGYEAPLQPYLEELIRRGYRQIVNIGCSFGYYAVGLAMRLPQARVAAHDIDEAFLALCRANADGNGVHERMSFGGVITGQEFASYPPGETLVVCDIEGGERELLDPDRFPALRRLDLVVEIHQNRTMHTQALLVKRFRASHHIRFVPNDRIEAKMPPIWWERHSLDQSVAAWEGRGEATPWLVMTAKDTP